MIVAATAATVVGAYQAVIATATQQDQQDDDPPAAVTAKTVITHKITSQFLIELLCLPLIPCYSAEAKVCRETNSDLSVCFKSQITLSSRVERSEIEGSSIERSRQITRSFDALTLAQDDELFENSSSKRNLNNLHTLYILQGENAIGNVKFLKVL